MGFAHKILWMSDLHQTVCGQVEGVNSRARLRQVIEQVNRHHPDAACRVVSGDLTDTGTPEEYDAHQTRPPHQTWEWSNFVAHDERPQYAVILIGPDRIVVQMTDIEDPA